MQANQRTKRHRSVPACARCYKLKQKCDRGTPRCLRCVGAGADCTSLNRQTSLEVPRSPVQYLEQRLAELKRSRTQKKDQDPFEGSRDGAPDFSHTKVSQIAAVSISRRTTTKLLTSRDAIQYEAKLFYPSERPPLKIPVHGIYHDIYPRTAGREYAAQFSLFNSRKIPLDVAKRLFTNYKDNILPRFPCFLVADINLCFEEYYSNSADQSNSTIFFVTLILAISSLTSKERDIRKVAALSEALHADAMRHVDFLAETSLLSLQAHLLLMQAALLLPHTANLWYTSGEAMRIAISLGLHQEPEQTVFGDAVHMELRRRIFWVTYHLERIVAISAGCPVAISDEHITTKMPFNGLSHALELDKFLRTLPASLQEKRFLISTKVRVLQSQIHSVQFFDHPLPSNELDHNTWVQEMKASIQNLTMYSTLEGIATPWLMVAIQQCQILLHRPCSREIDVPASFLIDATTISAQLISKALHLSLAGGFLSTFELANTAFQAGMVLLYAIRNHRVEIETAALVGESNEAMENLIRLYETLSIRWPALSDTARYIRELIDTNLRNPIGNHSSDYDMWVLEELDFLVTQRRIRSIFHRNLPIPTKQSNPPQNNPFDQISPSFLDDESWWQDFINQDFDIFDALALQPPPAESFTSLAASTRQEQDFRLRQKQHSFPHHVTYLDELVEALPACSSCRDRRIKCHRQLPACRECQRTSRDCVFFDPIQLENIPLERIAILVDKIKELSSQEPTSQGVSSLSQDSDTSQGAIVLFLSDVQGSVRPKTSSGKNSFHKAVFFGSRSCLGLLRSILKTCTDWDVPASIQLSKKMFERAGILDAPYRPNGELTLPVAQSLSRLFFRTVNTFFQISDEDSFDVIVSHYYDRANNDTGSCDILYLVLAISALIARRSEPGLVSCAKFYFDKAISSLGTTCDHSSRSYHISLLQRTLLICLYLLLDPSSGDIWRHLGFAIRLFLDLSHRPSKDVDKSDQLFCTLARALYCLESHVSIAYNRPSLLVIGDTLRDELTTRTTNTLQEHISVFSYLISFHKMLIHDALLRTKSDIAFNNSQQNNLQGHQKFRQDLDEWVVRWKEVINSLPDDSPRCSLESWGVFHYNHGLLMLSILWPGAGSDAASLCNNISTSCIEMIQQQQLFAQLDSGIGDHSPLAFPMTWTSAHVVVQCGLHLILNEDWQTPGQKLQHKRAVSSCLTALSVLEVNPDNLLTGQAQVIRDICLIKDLVH